MWGPGVWRKPCRKCLRMSFTAGVINKADAPWEVCHVLARVRKGNCD